MRCHVLSLWSQNASCGQHTDATIDGVLPTRETHPALESMAFSEASLYKPDSLNHWPVTPFSVLSPPQKSDCRDIM